MVYLGSVYELFTQVFFIRGRCVFGSYDGKSKENVNHMWRMPNDVAHPRRMDRAILIYGEYFGREDGPLTFAQANKRYSSCIVCC